MPGHLPELHPPARYGDLRELEQIFAKALPDMRFEVASLFGKRTPRLTRRESTRTRVKLSRFLHAVSPYPLFRCRTETSLGFNSAAFSKSE